MSMVKKNLQIAIFWICFTKCRVVYLFTVGFIHSKLEDVACQHNVLMYKLKKGLFIVNWKM